MLVNGFPQLVSHPMFLECGAKNKWSEPDSIFKTVSLSKSVKSVTRNSISAHIRHLPFSFCRLFFFVNLDSWGSFVRGDQNEVTLTSLGLIWAANVTRARSLGFLSVRRRWRSYVWNRKRFFHNLFDGFFSTDQIRKSLSSYHANKVMVFVPTNRFNGFQGKNWDFLFPLDCSLLSI